ncbi:YihY/virulence factor BrkB family protein [Siccirubricoccus sp. KC 17139]|uniref:YihY/virulence factor BrkB family protein n=1 Tax=Siccirubricoccus soli TaxID=2899147 RepID=A0ABT1D958_9PROT|nr:YihY/virulence factor BrkB family protein [Siccirubricoccus soli]MCO6418483.1 YihY/virulence factor BrkB family protein [Siccirubricoccus soli]MCP2684618.1 YihY/virulence factor BrkB family protein [Siccirubricoccus soli]
MLRRIWTLLRRSVEGYIEDDALSRGAAIAYYTVFSIAPLLVIATAIAGLVFGEAAVHGVISEQLQGLLGKAGADAVEAMIAGAGNKTSGTIATVVGIVTLLLTASGVFGEVQSSLNAIWRAPPPPGDAVTRVLRAKLAALLAVIATGFLLLASLVASAVLSAFGSWAGGVVPEVLLLLGLANFGLSFLLVAALFAAIYKILPNRPVAWGDVVVGALVTAFLFTLGKSVIGWYIGSSSVASTYGAAGALMGVLLWVYYSAQIFLLGAEFTRAWAGLHEVEETAEAPAPQPEGRTHWLVPAAAGALVMALLRGRR